MALITAKAAVDLRAIDLHDLVAGSPAGTLLNNTLYTSPQNYLYEDVIRYNVPGSPDTQVRFGGPSFTVDAGGTVTSGTVSGLLTKAAAGAALKPWYAIEGIVLGAAAVFSALDTPSTSDDHALLQTALAGADTFNLSSQADAASGFAGNDTLNGKGGQDTLEGGDGQDQLFGGNGADTLRGEAGNDTLDGGDGNDRLDGGSFGDRMLGGAGDDTYVVDSEGDFVTEDSGAGFDTVRSAVSHILPSNVEAVVLTGSTAFYANGNERANKITGNEAGNSLVGREGHDTLIGGAGSDTLVGEAGNDSMAGGAGKDLYYVDSAKDTVTETAGEGADTVRSPLTWTLSANVEHLELTDLSTINGTGNGLDNRLTGNVVANQLFGKGGNDTLDGGTGSDTLSGGAGLDTFRFTSLGNPWNNLDRVTDFKSADDRLQLDNAGYAMVGADGALPAQAFALGARARNLSDRIIYDQATGAMYYDSDGTGIGAQLQFAQFDAGTQIVPGDLFII